MKIEKNREEAILICKSEYEYEEIVEQAITQYFSYESYLSFTDGNTIPLINCPECGHDTYVYFEKQCLFCGSSFEHTCGRDALQKSCQKKLMAVVFVAGVLI